MSLPYENATAGENALSEMQRILQKFGAQSFGSMLDFEKGTLIVQFKYRGYQVHLEASAKGYAACWLKENPWNTSRSLPLIRYQEKALKLGAMACYSILRDWLKGQLMAIETGVLSFEGAFLSQIMLPTGKTILQTVADQNILRIESE